MKATKNLRKSIISGLLTLVMAAAMFVCMGKVEVQAATKDLLELEVGDELFPGDVIDAVGDLMVFLRDAAEGDREYDGSKTYGYDVYIKESYKGMLLSKFRVLKVDWAFSGEATYVTIFVEMVVNGKAETPVVTGPIQLEDGTFFDAAYYAATYPDVATVLGTDETVLYNHYVLCGKAEGRFPNATVAPSVAGPKQMADGTLFDAAYYAATYPDVVAAFGTDEAMLYNHYVLCGKAEGRLPYAM